MGRFYLAGASRAVRLDVIGFIRASGLLDRHRRLHEGVDRAEVSELARVVEPERVAPAEAEDAAIELAGDCARSAGGDGMGGVVPVGPGDRSPGGNGDGLMGEARKVVI